MKNIAPLKQYIRLKYSGNASEFAREYQIDPKNVAKMYETHWVDMRDGTLFRKAKNQPLSELDKVE